MKEIPSPKPELPQAADQYTQPMYAHLPDHRSTVKKVSVRDSVGPNLWVNLDEGSMRQVHKSQLFTQDEVIKASDDLFHPHRVGEEVHVSQAIQEIIDHPLTGSELAIRLGVRALEKYIATPRTREELGLREESELLGESTIPGSNRWKIKALAEGINRGIYKPGAHNELALATPAKDIETLPKDEAAKIREEINAVNRQVLDILYEEYDADFTRAMVYERRHKGLTERKTVIPSTASDFSFVETSYIPDEETATTVKPHGVDVVQVIVGVQEYSSEDGYLPAI